MSVDRIVQLFQKLLPFLFGLALLWTLLLPVLSLIDFFNEPVAPEDLRRAWVIAVLNTSASLAKVLFLFGAVYVLLDIRDRLGKPNL